MKPLTAEDRRTILEGDKIAAIKTFRYYLNLSLVECKQVVEAIREGRLKIEDALGPAEPPLMRCPNCNGVGFVPDPSTQPSPAAGRACEGP